MTADGPARELITQGRLAAYLRTQGVRPGSTVVAHISLSSMGWVCGGIQAVIGALLGAVGDDGTVAMPTRSLQLDGPAYLAQPEVMTTSASPPQDSTASGPAPTRGWPAPVVPGVNLTRPSSFFSFSMVAMVIDLADRTVLPPAEASLTEIAAQLAAISSPDGLSLVLPDGQTLLLPGPVADALRDVVATLAQGKAIAITSRDTTLTTQAAAELLGISRPTLIRLLEAGEIPYQQPGRHRRVQLTDLLDYQDRIRHRRHEVLAEMADDAADDNAYFTAAGFVDTR